MIVLPCGAGKTMVGMAAMSAAAAEFGKDLLGRTEGEVVQHDHDVIVRPCRHGATPNAGETIAEIKRQYIE